MTTRRTIICYHAIGACPNDDDPDGLFVDERTFEAQMRFLARWRNVVSLDAILDGEPPGRRPAVAITFDDGYRNVLRKAAPILARFAFPATVFVPTKWIGGANMWDSPERVSRCDLSVMTADELVEAESAGLSIESHGHAHVALDGDAADPVTDLSESRKLLEDVLGRKPKYLAYPFGPYSPELMRAAEDAGFEAAFTVSPFTPAGRFALGRVAIWRSDSMVSFALKTTGRYLSWRSSRLQRMVHATLQPILRRR